MTYAGYATFCAPVSLSALSLKGSARNTKVGQFLGVLFTLAGFIKNLVQFFPEVTRICGRFPGFRGKLQDFAKCTGFHENLPDFIKLSRISCLINWHKWQGQSNDQYFHIIYGVQPRLIQIALKLLNLNLNLSGVEMRALNTENLF